MAEGLAEGLEAGFTSHWGIRDGSLHFGQVSQAGESALVSGSGALVKRQRQLQKGGGAHNFRK